ncbi:MAG: alkaline phosphatase family protein [Deltaproteobacteria bacterium]|nr:alkaline phosphatase family protein [Deltaproteobacteria bacterium]
MRAILSRLVLCCGLVGAAVPARAASAQAAMPPRDVYAVLFVLDGARVDLVRDAVAQGLMPTLRREFQGGGAVFDDARAVFPTITPAGYQAMVSGLLPGHAGIPYLEWYDRARKRRVRFLSARGMERVNGSFENWYDPGRTRTLFDDLAGHPTAAVFSVFSRHASVRRPVRLLPAFLAVAVAHRYDAPDAEAFRALTELFEQPLDQVPRFSLVGLLSTDTLGHHVGSLHAATRDNLRVFDARLAAFLDLLRARGIADRTYLVITADHGMHDIVGVFRLKKYLRRHGIAPRRLVIAARGIGSAMVYSKEGTPTMPADLPDIISRAPEVAFVAARDGDGRVRVVAHDGEGRIVRRGRSAPARYDYRVVAGVDPLHGIADAARQVGQLFDDGRAGDCVVVNTADWGFFRRKEATHGTLLPADMRVPLFIRGPGVPRRTIAAPVSLVDLYPTMLHWFGLGPPRAPIDGTAIPFQPAR